MDPERQIRRFFATWNTRDAAAMSAFYAEDTVMEDPTLPAPRRGREAIAAYYEEMFAALEDPYHDLLDWAWRDNRLWFEWTFGSGGGARPREDYRGASIQTFRGDEIVHDTAYWRPADA